MPARLDRTLGNPRALRLRTDLERADWTTTASLLADLKDALLKDFYVGVAADWPGRPAWLDAWCQESPRSAAPWLVRGAHSVLWAWEARGGRTAEHVTTEAWDPFFGRLHLAEQDLRRAATLDPADPTPWSVLITVMQGLQRPQAEELRCFEEAVRRSPGHLGAHRRLLTALTEKWGGSHEAMFDFARRTVASSPDGSSLPMILALAHVERWLAYGLAEDTQFLRYWRRADVAADIELAWKRSIGSPRFSSPLQGIPEHNLFAFCFWKQNEPRRARRELLKTQSIVTDGPWQYLGEPVAIYSAACQECSEQPALETALADEIRAACEHAVAFVARMHSVRLDYEEGSLARLDDVVVAYARQLHALDAEAARKAAVQVALWFGAYLGEVLRRRVGGTWVSRIQGVEGDVRALRCGSRHYYPLNAVHCRLTQSDAPPLRDAFCAWLAEALAPPAESAPTANAPERAPWIPRTRATNDAEAAWIESTLIGETGDAQALMRAMTDDAELGGRLLEMVRAALLTASATWDMELDFSPESLELLDVILEELHVALRAAPQAPQPSTERFQTAVAIWGAYLGEVVRRQLGGKWLEDRDPNQGTLLCLRFAGHNLLPHGRVTKRIRRGASERVADFLRLAEGMGIGAPPASDEGPAPAAAPESLLTFARQTIALAFSLAADGTETIHPTLVSERSGQKTVVSYAAFHTAEAMVAGRRQACAQPPNVERVAFVYDAYVTEQGVKSDCLFVEAHERGCPVGFAWGQRYRRDANGRQQVGDLFENGVVAAFLHANAAPTPSS